LQSPGGYLSAQTVPRFTLARTIVPKTRDFFQIRGDGLSVGLSDSPSDCRPFLNQARDRSTLRKLKRLDLESSRHPFPVNDPLLSWTFKKYAAWNPRKRTAGRSPSCGHFRRHLATFIQGGHRLDVQLVS
jgi:hypothetical protein